jgi:hypothetical protein
MDAFYGPQASAPLHVDAEQRLAGSVPSAASGKGARVKGYGEVVAPIRRLALLGEDALELGQAGLEDPGADPVGYCADVARGVEGR